MLKTGIYTLEQIKSNKFKTILGGDKRISITLYDQILNVEDSSNLAERVLLLFTDERGAYKRTYKNRFADFDRNVLEILAANFTKDSALQMQDVAVSDGRTAVDFFEKIRGQYSHIEYVASDYNPTVYVVEKGAIKLTLSRDNKIIEMVCPPFVFNAANPDVLKYHFLNRVVQFFAERIYVKPVLREFLAGKLQSREIHLFCPAATTLAKNDSRFTLAQHNILNAFKTKNHIIRAMNIFNVTYFSKDEFKIVIKNMHDGLHLNGLLIVGSNQDSGSLVHGAVYRKTQSGFVKLWQSGSGPAIDSLIIGMGTI